MSDLKISIIDYRQSKKPPAFKSLAMVCVVAAMFFGPGLLAGSAAMQWAGFAVLVILGLITLAGLDRERLTIEEARARLDALSSD